MIDYASAVDYAWVLLPELVLSAAAMIVLLVDVFQKGDASRPSSRLIPALAGLGVAAAFAANLWLLGLQEADATGMIALDSFRVFSNALFLLAVALFLGMAPRYLEENGMHLGELYALVLFATVGMMVFAGSRDLIVIFLGLELLSIAVYVLTAANRRDQRSAEAGLKYFLLGAFSSAFLLFGVAMIYGGTGTVNLVRLGDILADGGGPLVTVGLALLLVGFGFKIAAVPFHMWTPDAYEGAPTPITAFMAAAVKAAAFAALVRVLLTAFPGMYATWGQLAFWLAMLTMVGANLVALAQDNVKRLLAYSSIAHAGYLLVAVAAGTDVGAAAFLFYLSVYTLMNVGAFAVVMTVAGLGEARMGIGEYSGLAWRKPALAIAMTIFLLSLAGFPLTGGFIGKLYILRAAVERGLLALAIVLVLTSLVSYWYYLRVAWHMWFHDPAEGGARAPLRIPLGVVAVLAVCALGVLAAGLFPAALLDLASAGATALGGPSAAVAGAAAP
ncbi:MAG: NADH-quinone oxidoreductase subunit N [Gemmatimonadota bacterium]